MFRWIFALLILPNFSFCQTGEPIKDNSFLIEEAYNQEKGVLQHIFFTQFDSTFKSFEGSFTQEWPVGGIHHQLSYTLITDYDTSGLSLNNILLNYRYQLFNVESFALAPRFSVKPPINKNNTEGWGVQINIPASFDYNDKLFFHVNAGANFAWSYPGTGYTSKYLQVPIGASIIYCPLRIVNLMCEFVHTTYSVFHTTELNHNKQTEVAYADDDFVINPGIRAAINFKNGLQIVPGFAVPINMTLKQTGYIFYLSFEHPFKKT